MYRMVYLESSAHYTVRNLERGWLSKTLSE